ncbi:MAG: NnrU family protein [Gammaproteobacteria bacterium]|nr:NnrU family protein [Gammaproteobacteria bacterium]MDD9957669.1 NnrU family protein [Gammaproteobacteria bacterium]
MLVLCLGLALFLLPHLFREFGLRDKFRNELLGIPAYMGMYSVCALVGLALIIWGKSIAPFVMVWEPVFELRYISSILMIPAFIFVVAGNIPMSFIRWQLRNPMLLGVCIWGSAHLWANGDLASMLLFGSFSLWAGLKFVSLRNNFQSTLVPESGWLWRDLIAVVVGAIIYFIVYVSHGQLFGVGLAIN